MNIIIEIDSVNAQFVYVKDQKNGSFTIEVGDVAIQLPRWSLEELNGRILVAIESANNSESA